MAPRPPGALERILASPHTTERDIRKLAGSILPDDFDTAAASRYLREQFAASLAEAERICKGGGGHTRDGNLVKAERLAKATGSAEDIGTQQQGVAFSSADGSELAPLVPQSFDGEMKRLSLDEKLMLVAWPDLFKVPVRSMVREAVIETATNNRPNQSGFIAEGGAGYNSRGAYARRIVTVRMEAQRGEISDIAMLVRGATPTGFADKGNYETVRQARMRTLLKIRERNLWTGSHGANSLSYDGFIPAIAGESFSSGGVRSYGGGDGRFYDLAGSLVDAKLLRDIANDKATPKNGVSSMIRKYYIHPKVWQVLHDEAQANTRYDGKAADSKNPLRFFGGKVVIGGIWYDAVKGVELVCAPFIGGGEYQRNPNSTATGDTIGSFTASVSAGSSANSRFTSSGTYYWRITAVGENGESAPVTTSAQAVAAGESATIDLTETNGSTILYYDVERSTRNGAASTSQWIGRYPKNTGGGAGVTRIVDDNLQATGCAPIVGLTDDKNDYQWEQLLPAYVKPLAVTGTTQPFLCLDFGALFVIAPEKQIVIGNAAFSS